MVRLYFAVLSAVLSFHVTTSAQATPEWHFDTGFTQQNQTELTTWILRNEAGLVQLFGPLPFRYQVYFHLQKHSLEPVPWANTDKRNGRAVHFYVDPQFESSSFLADWTAPHELSHLLFPYLRSDSAWFSEGIATYLQYQVMYASGIISWQQAVEKMRTGFRNAGNSIQDRHRSIQAISQDYPNVKNFPRLYWGGAAYFLQVDRQLLVKKRQRLHTIIREYVNCCFTHNGMNAQKLMTTFDQISGDNIFQTTYTNTVAEPGFPEVHMSLNWLSDNPPFLDKGHQQTTNK